MSLRGRENRWDLTHHQTKAAQHESSGMIRPSSQRPSQVVSGGANQGADEGTDSSVQRRNGAPTKGPAGTRQLIVSAANGLATIAISPMAAAPRRTTVHGQYLSDSD